MRSRSTKCPTAWPNGLLICRVADSRVDTVKLLFRRVYPFFTESAQTVRFTCEYHIDNKQIKQVTTAKYLGVTIDKNLNWSDHTSRVVSKANSVLGFYNVMSVSAVWKLSACVTGVWSVLYWNMQVSYGHLTINITSTA